MKLSGSKFYQKPTLKIIKDWFKQQQCKTFTASGKITMRLLALVAWRTGANGPVKRSRFLQTNPVEAQSLSQLGWPWLRIRTTRLPRNENVEIISMVSRQIYMDMKVDGKMLMIYQFVPIIRIWCGPIHDMSVLVLLLILFLGRSGRTDMGFSNMATPIRPGVRGSNTLL